MSGEVKRVGLGYRGEFPADGVELDLERLREQRGEIHGELFVRLRGQASDFAEGHLFGGNFNASSLTARSTVAKYLNSRIKLDWAAILERFCLAVLREERRGEDFETAGDQPSQANTVFAVDPILPYGKTSILFGRGGSFKSTTAAGIGVSVRTGSEIIPGWKSTPGAVLVLDWEDDRQTWNDRVRAIALGRGLAPPTLHYRRMARPLADDFEGIARFVGEQNVLLMIVDSVMLASGSSRDGQNWTDATGRLFAALREMKTTALLIDHVAGSDLQTDQLAAKPYGDIFKTNWARNVYQLKKERESVGDRTELLLHHTKTNGRTQPDLGLAITYGENTIRFERAEVEAPDLVKGLSVRTRMARLLRSGPQPPPGIAEALDIPAESIRSAVFRDQRASSPTFVKLPDGRIGLAHRE